MNSDKIKRRTSSTVTPVHYKPGPFLHIFILFMCTNLSPSCLNAETKEVGSPSQTALIDKIGIAMDYFYRMDSQKANKILDDTIDEWPLNPLPYLFKAGLCLQIY
jgi:Tfp pilus assembly protein PilF